MLSINQLCKQFNIARTTLLYYERKGLIKPGRGSNGYRQYNQQQCDRLQQILELRALDVPVTEILQLLEQPDANNQRQILQQQFSRLGDEIARLQQQQRTILSYLQQQPLQDENAMISKERWTEIMRSAGLTDQDMHNWHRQFEALEPEAHQEFLESLGIEQNEVEQIRQWSSSAS